MIEKIRALINREIKEENEPKETAVLVRMLCLIDALAFTVTSVILFMTYGVAAGAMALGAVALMLIVFVAL